MTDQIKPTIPPSALWDEERLRRLHGLAGLIQARSGCMLRGFILDRAVKASDVGEVADLLRQASVTLGGESEGDTDV